MGWKNKSYKFKGLIIGGAIGLLIGLFFGFYDNLGLIDFVEHTLINCTMGSGTNPCNFFQTILGFGFALCTFGFPIGQIIFIIIGSLVGLIIGWFTGKIKSK